jgi:hypothetical protein
MSNTDTPWIKASASGSQGNCVQMRLHSGTVEVRDSKNPDGPVHAFTRDEFAAWLDGAKNGEFDHLVK